MFRYNGHMTGNTEMAIWSRLIDPDKPDFSSDAAQALLRLEFDRDDVKRMDELASLARDGKLSIEEKEELNNYNRVGHLLALLHSKARRSLSRPNAA